jgi:hypothetical protein
LNETAFVDCGNSPSLDYELWIPICGCTPTGYRQESPCLLDTRFFP